MGQEIHTVCDRECRGYPQMIRQGWAAPMGRKGMGRPVVNWHDTMGNQQDVGW